MTFKMYNGQIRSILIKMGWTFADDKSGRYNQLRDVISEPLNKGSSIQIKCHGSRKSRDWARMNYIISEAEYCWT
jgi:hypothetical protein